MNQSYRVCFANPRAPTFTFGDPPYSFAWVREFAAGIASAIRKDFEEPADGLSDARVRGERMGQTLKLYGRRWGIAEEDFRAIRIEWRLADGTARSIYYEALERTHD